MKSHAAAVEAAHAFVTYAQGKGRQTGSTEAIVRACREREEGTPIPVIFVSSIARAKEIQDRVGTTATVATTAAISSFLTGMAQEPPVPTLWDTSAVVDLIGDLLNVAAKAEADRRALADRLEGATAAHQHACAQVVHLTDQLRQAQERP